MNTKQNAKPVPLVEQLRAAVRAPIGRRAATIEQVRSQIIEQRDTGRARLNTLREETDRALLDSPEAYAKNQIGIQECEDAEKHLEALLALATKEVQRAALGDEEHELREEGTRVLTALRDAAKRSAEYEKLAKQIAEVLKAHRDALESYGNFQYRARESAKAAERGAQWLAAIMREYYDEQAMGALDVLGAVATLHEVVQLPSVTRLEPHWGDVFGRSQEEPKHAMEASAPTRAMGVYGADGRRMPQYRSAHHLPGI